jgi:hypothetical protein
MESNWNKHNNWFKLSPSRYLSVINRISDVGARGDILLIAMHMLDEMGLKDDDTEIAWITGLPLERISEIRPYLDRLKDKDRHDDRLMFDFVLATIVERQEFADKKAKAGQSGGRTRKAQQSSAKHSKAVQSSVIRAEANESKTKQNEAIHTDIHVVLDKSRTSGEAEPAPVSKKSPDLRKDHIAITTCRSVAHSFPPKEIWDDLILLLGETPDRTRLESCRKEWVSRGYKPTNWAWVTEWYPNGAPMNGARGSPVTRETDTHYADGREKPTEKKGFVC